jgi:STE24 endopeptidase
MMWVLVALLLIEYAISTTLSVLNVTHLRQVAAHLPAEWAERLDTTQTRKMVAYATSNSQLGHGIRLTNLVLTLIILGSGLLPGITLWAVSLGDPADPTWRGVAEGLVVWAVLGGLSYLVNVPWDLVSSFGVERRFGFSTITLRTWLTDQAKSLGIAALLGLLLGGGLLLLIGWLGTAWWIPAWILFCLFQLLMAFVAPVVLLPLFNTFEPLQDRELSDEIAALARRADFPLGGVFQVDASLRSTHSNAYFTGFGKTRRIALFDTLLDRHPHRQILAILAHEIGHWKKGHIAKGLAATFLVSGVAIALVAALLGQPWIYEAVGIADLYAGLGLQGPVAATGLYVVALLLSPLGLILAPVAMWFSRRHEYEADAYSLELYQDPMALEQSLIGLSEENLSNLFPHPLVVVFRYSHPPLPERVAAIRHRSGQ